MFPIPKVSLVLQNTGSVARDHLASERTWLSYVHTSLGIVTMGVALIQLFTLSSETNSLNPNPKNSRLHQFARPLGAATVFLGLYVLAIGIQRYFAIQHALTVGEFPAARLAAFSITCLLAILVSVTFGVVAAVSQ